MEKYSELVGKIFRKIGTRQRYKVIDKYILCDDFEIKSLEDMRRNYVGSERISRLDLLENFKPETSE